jgi:hypothetical protein
LFQDFVAALIEYRRCRHGKDRRSFMNAESQMRSAPSISGNTIDLGAGHSIAIYERNGGFWVAEFRDGRGEFTYAGQWFRLDAGRLRHRRAAIRSAAPLTPAMVESIERLHRESEAREERMLAVPRTIAAAVQRYWISLISRIRGCASKTSQTLG